MRYGLQKFFGLKTHVGRRRRVTTCDDGLCRATTTQAGRAMMQAGRATTQAGRAQTGPGRAWTGPKSQETLEGHISLTTC